jgi:hypothetical protein
MIVGRLDYQANFVYDGHSSSTVFWSLDLRQTSFTGKKLFAVFIGFATGNSL